MEKMDDTRIRQEEDERAIDVMHILDLLWHKAWLILLVGVLIGAILFSCAAFLIQPKYAASVMLYVNNSDFTLGSTSISMTDLTASQSLTKTYIVILRNRTTLELLIEETGVDYTYEELLKMINAGAVDNTEVFSITVTSTDPREAAELANGISRILPDRVSDIIDGSSVRLVDSAVVPTKKVSPSITKYTALGFVIGILLACTVLIVRDLLDDIIHDEDYLIKSYNIPILAKIPNLLSERSDGYGYYERRQSGSGKSKSEENQK